jgi:hypothetical protein
MCSLALSLIIKYGQNKIYNAHSQTLILERNEYNIIIVWVFIAKNECYLGRVMSFAHKFYYYQYKNFNYLYFFN